MKIIQKFKKIAFIAVLLISSYGMYGQGPNAPEAASFEPVDATDMVNLSTGDFTYVLPLLNVPSPEGGYPISLAYHAGIAMDQEASWTGLGWNVNAGAINRSINGYPDDYNDALISEYFYHEGGEDYISNISLSYSGGFSVGVGVSWSGNRGMGGYVSVGYGIDLGESYVGASVTMGTNGVGINLGLTTSGGLTIGVNAHTNGNISGGIGYDSIKASVNSNKGDVSGSFSFNSNGIGYSMSTDGTAEITTGFKVGPIGANLSTKSGVSLASVGGIGVGIGQNTFYENTISMGDYTTITSGWQIPLVIPTPIGVFSLSFGKQNFRYVIGKNERNYISGPVYFNNGSINGGKWRVSCAIEGADGNPEYYDGGIFYSAEDANNFANNLYSSNCNCACQIDQFSFDDSFMDIYEVPIVNSEFSNSSQIEVSNATFPGYDRYNVQAQGLSGGISSRLYENGNLYGLSSKENDEGYKLSFAIDGSSTTVPGHAQFNSKPYFYFDNEISTYTGVVDVSEANFNSNSTNADILDYYADDNSVELDAKSRRKNASYIEYFTNEEIKSSYNFVKTKGYLIPESGFDINSPSLPESGIGAFKVTGINGMTYHYSLPVYNHETVTRTFGVDRKKPLESQSYHEKRQLEPYATHWLLTAVTGPDFFDTNNNGIADKGDYGNWTTFEYGKWSDAFAWKAPYGKDYIESIENNALKTSIKGRKQIYYLDRVKTRTHTALFVKSSRNDALSYPWNYRSVLHVNAADQNSNSYNSAGALRFQIPEQEQLKLDKIILVKEQDDNVNKEHSSSNENYVNVHFNNSDKPSEQGWYNLKDNIIDVSDNINNVISKSIKVIDFQYDYNLAKGRPNTNGPTYGSLTLQSVHFKGRGADQLIPPYSFNYINDNSYVYDIEDKDGFGYYKNDNSMWSLNEIVTPQGGKIQINYETHSFNAVVKPQIKFSNGNDEYTLSSTSNQTIFTISSDHNLSIQVGETLDFSYGYTCFLTGIQGCGEGCDGESFHCSEDLTATVIENLGNNTFRIQVPNGNCLQAGQDIECSNDIEVLSATYQVNNTINDFGGIRVASLITTDGATSYRTAYKYGENENGIGHISYLPFAPELQEELPYSAELPAPRVMYEYVSMQSFGTNSVSNGKIQYKFKVLKEKDEDAIKFGDLYEIDINNINDHYNATSNKEVSINKYTVKDNLATLGQLLEVSTFNNEGHVLSKIENTYYSPTDPTPNSVGVTKEAYQTYKIVDYINNTATKKDRWLINSSARIKYPSLLKSSTEYKSGYEYSSQFGELDPITGQANEVLSISSDGTQVKSRSIPAYHKYLEMGSKVDNVDNENMLSQTTASYSYIKDPVNNTWKETSVGISTWSKNWSYRTVNGTEQTESNPNAHIWRRHKEYIWNGDLNEDGTYKDFIDDFNWNSITQSSKWKEISETTKYDHYSMPLEIKDINNNHATTKMCDEDSKILVTGNAQYGEMYYSGAEYKEGGVYLDNEVKGAVYQSMDYAHTGKYSLAITPNQRGFETVLRNGQHDAGKYKISIWAKKDNASNTKIHINGATIAFNGESVTAGDWVLLNHYETLDGTNETAYITSTSGTIYIDDFRIHPIASSMTSYVYNEWNKLAFITGSNNLSTCFIYDSQGRLIETQTETIDSPALPGGFKKVSENFYNYKNQ